MLTLVQTDPKPIGAGLRAKLSAMRRSLPQRYRADLDDMRLFSSWAACRAIRSAS
jgi:hypothetical protein